MLRPILVKACLLSVAFLASANVSNAAIVTESFTLIIDDGGLFDGTVSTFGGFSYNDAFLDGFGDGILTSGDGLLSVDITIFGQTFSIGDDADFPGYPELEVVGGVPISLDYIVSEFGFNPTMIDELDLVEFGFDFSSFALGVGGLEATGFAVSGVPEPSSLVLLGALGGFGLLMRRKRGMKKTC